MDNYLAWLVILCCITTSCSVRLSLNVQPSGSFTISLNSQVWFTNSPFKLFAGMDNKWYQSDLPGSLKLTAVTNDTGYDAIGGFSSITLHWLGGMVRFDTIFKTYENQDTIVFEQYFPDGNLNGTSGSVHYPSATFPNLHVQPKLGFLHYSGDFAGHFYQVGVWPTKFGGGETGGPLALFDQDLNTVIISSYVKFTQVVHNINNSDSSLSYGPKGTFAKIPPGYKVAFIMHAGTGVHRTFENWGNLLLLTYNKIRTPYNANNMIKYLGYSTTAYYFYNPISGNESYGNYEETILAVHDYAQKSNIPYKYYLIDSWWYGEYTVYNGVWMWEDSPILLKERFPHGLTSLHQKLGVPFAAHIGKWRSTTPYLTKYKFISEEQVAIPQSPEFWDYIFSQGQNWGLQVMKQDHINEQIDQMKITQSDVNVIDNWLLQEGYAAGRHGISIQYCMDWPSIVLQSVMVPAATHTRASGDYTPTAAQTQWNVATTSMFSWSVGLLPFKDSFYSSTTEVITNNKDALFYNYKEKYPMLHALVSVMSCGPVAPSDGVEGSDPVLIMRSCAQDGTLLKPDRPMMNIDSTWIKRTLGVGGSVGPDGEVWSTYTTLDQNTWHYVFSNTLTKAYSFTVDDLMIMTGDTFVAYLFNKNSPSNITPVPFDKQNPISLPVGENWGDFQLWTIAPIFDNHWTFLGETDKFVAVSKQRIEQISSYSDGIVLQVVGAPGEMLTFSFYDTINKKVQVVSGMIKDNGRAVITTVLIN